MNGATTPLCRAIFNGNEPIALMLLEKGADIDGVTKKTGRSPLMWAAFRGNLQMTELLLERGADKELVDHEGLNCFDIAVIRL